MLPIFGFATISLSVKTCSPKDNVRTFSGKNFNILNFRTLNKMKYFACTQIHYIVVFRFCSNTLADFNIRQRHYTTFRRFFKRFNGFSKPRLLCRPLLIGHAARHGVGLARLRVSRPAFGDIVHIIEIRRCCAPAPRVKRR